MNTNLAEVRNSTRNATFDLGIVIADLILEIGLANIYSELRWVTLVVGIIGLLALYKNGKKAELF